MNALDINPTEVEIELSTEVVLPSGVEVSVSGELLLVEESFNWSNVYFANGNSTEIKVAKAIIMTAATELYDDPDSWEVSDTGPVFNADPIDYVLQEAA